MAPGWLAATAAPGQTADRFLPDPFGGQPGARLYRTGDLGRWLRTAGSSWLGRVDRQVKVRGFRIETGEVEAALRGHPEVRDAVVVTVAGAVPGDTRLVGYVVTAPGAPDPSGGLREHLRHLLPDYMLPAAFVMLGAAPDRERKDRPPGAARTGLGRGRRADVGAPRDAA